jgi:hypothetical protein
MILSFSYLGMQIKLETNAYVEEYADTLGILIAVGVFVAIPIAGVDTALLICIGHYVAIVENVVDVKVEVEANLAVDIDKLADRQI